MRDFHLPGRSEVFAEKGMCATSHPIAARVAVDTLQAGGNAVDAALAAGMVLGICEPHMTGIGGDCFALLSVPGLDDIVALNGSGRGPAGLSAPALRAAGHKTVPVASAHAVTVPGAVDAFCRLSDDWGKLGLDRVLAPAIHYAEAGVPVAPRVAKDWIEDGERLQGSARERFLKNGAAFRPGQRFAAPDQAEVLRRIAKEGRAAFYEGDVAEDMIASLNALGGTHTAEDFAKTQSDYTTPISAIYKTAELVEHPPNGQGATALLMNNMLAHFDVAGMDPWGVERVHLQAEVTKRAYDLRNRLVADADYMTRLAYMLAPETAAQLVSDIDPAKASGPIPRIVEAVHRDTVYLTVVDRDRMAISLIYSIFDGFGSGIASEKFGILFQNRGAGFSLEEGHPNEAEGGKRPLHTIIPGMIRRGGRVDMSFGVMGGQYQSAGHANFVGNIEDFGLSGQAAIDGPRSFADEGILKVERGFSPDVHAKLADMGHNVVVPDGPIGGAQAITIHHDLGVLEGASDPRKDGCALGY